MLSNFSTYISEVSTILEVGYFYRVIESEQKRLGTGTQALLCALAHEGKRR
jgi:hypothetical protein